MVKDTATHLPLADCAQTAEGRAVQKGCSTARLGVEMGFIHPIDMTPLDGPTAKADGVKPD